jgi:hypothetical protein
MIDRACLCETASVAGFIQQLAVSCVGNGYFFYVLGHVPEGKDPAHVDAKLVERYGIDISKWTRARRKQAGRANVQYLRFGRLFALMATPGEHLLFELEGDCVRDVRGVPLKAFGYAISHRGGRVQVRIEREEFKRLRAHLLALAPHREGRSIADEFLRLRYEPYAPVRRQLLHVLSAVNAKRRAAGFDAVPPEVLRRYRKIVRPFSLLPPRRDVT